MTKRVALYVRCSTGEQTTDNQRRELRHVAERHGWSIVAVHDDSGISGATSRDDRRAMRAMLKSVARREVDLVAAWAVDRLGRSLPDLLGFLGELHAKGVDLYLHQQGLDTSTPSGRAMFGMMGVFAEFERAMIRERVKAGMARAQVAGTRSGRAIGRPRISDAQRQEAELMLHAGASIAAVARHIGLGVGTIHRLQAQLARQPTR